MDQKKIISKNFLLKIINKKRNYKNKYIKRSNIYVLLPINKNKIIKNKTNTNTNIIKTNTNIIKTINILNTNIIKDNYLNNIINFNKLYLININNILINPKIEFRYFCYRYLNYIKSIKLPEILKESNYEAVLIEFRIFPHIEFIIRNNILKLGSNWNYTVICGNLNYDYIKDMCKTISDNINIIKLDYNNVSPSEYSIILSSIDFWNLFKGEKILIHQEDSIIFKNNINNFIKWDYIGAPWPKNQNDNLNNVGNGGFSLRTKQCMIDVINKISINDTQYNNSTLTYIKNSNSNIPPEDVYFSKNMIDFNIGKVANWNSAFNFSSESFYNPESLGGHCFWTNNKKWKIPLYKNIVIQVNRINNFKSEHRGGWNSVMESLNENIINNKANLIFLDMIEKHFLWDKNGKIITDWCGIMHCTHNVPIEWDICNIDNLFINLSFLESINKCKFIITLSNYVKDYISEKFNEININIPIIFIKHPIKIEDFPKFNIESYINNEDKKLIQIGQQLRKITSIFEVNITNHQKLWLTGLADMKLAEDKLIKEYIKINKELPSNYQKLFKYIKNINEYDKLLKNNIVFLDLYDSAANNTVLECIVRNTPLIINRTPGVIEYLGENYPLYFDNLDQVESLLDIEKLKSATKYLENMNKEDITMEYFIENFIKVLYQYS